jgi:hypothetical protein
MVTPLNERFIMHHDVKMIQDIWISQGSDIANIYFEKLCNDKGLKLFEIMVLRDKIMVCWL